ncbi:helix-turn-helix transcriptional regulator [Cytobacillus kochii]
MDNHWGTILRMKRYELNLTQKEVGQIIGIAERTLGEYEKGHVKHPKIKNLRSLCDLYNLDIKKIIDQISDKQYI